MPANTPQNLDSLFRELEKLTDDLRSLRTGEAPSERELQACPIIDEWSFGFLPAPCLVGAVSGHPILTKRPSPSILQNWSSSIRASVGLAPGRGSIALELSSGTSAMPTPKPMTTVSGDVARDSHGGRLKSYEVS